MARFGRLMMQVGYRLYRWGRRLALPSKRGQVMWMETYLRHPVNRGRPA